jgi:hypothetical protein
MRSRAGCLFPIGILVTVAAGVPSLHAQQPASPSVATNVTLSLSKIEGFSNAEISELQIYLQDGFDPERGKYPPELRQHLAILGLLGSAGIDETLRAARMQDAEAAVFLEAQKTPSKIWAQMSIFIANVVHSQSSSLGEIVPPRTFRQFPTLTSGSALAERDRNWTGPFLLQTSFAPESATVGSAWSAVQILSGWVSANLARVLGGMVPVDLLIRTSPGGADLLLDQDRLGLTPQKDGVWRGQFFREPGNYILKASKDGFFDETRPIPILRQKNTLTIAIKFRRRKIR